MNKKKNLINILLWLASVVSMIGIMILSSRLFEENNVELLIEFTIIAIVTLIYLYLISGKKTFSYLGNQTGYAIKLLFPTLIFSIFFMLLGVLSVFLEKPDLNPNWIRDLLIASASMFLVGVYEEGCFRACACDALLPALKNWKHPFFLTAIISGLVFGYVHVVSVDFSDLQQVLQFILKIVNLLVNGAAYMLVYWKTRNLLALAIVHGLNDFIPDFLNQIFLFQIDDSGTYVTGDVGTTIVYSIQLVVGIICLIHVYRRVNKDIDYPKTLQEW